MRSRPAALLALARACGVKPSYRDSTEQRREVPGEVLIGVLRALGVGLDGPDDAEEALRVRTLASWRQLAEPVVVAPAGREGVLEIRRPASHADDVMSLDIQTEDGSSIGEHIALADAEPVAKADLPDGAFVSKRITLPALDAGYHRIQVRVPGAESDVLAIAAPTRLGGARERTWGLFAPLYAIRGARGIADLGDLARLMDLVAGAGGGIIATLPLLATFLDEPFEPSPYSPVSRLFWNELYADLAAAPEIARAPEARALLDRVPDGNGLVDYKAVMAAKARVLASLAPHWAEGDHVLGSDDELAGYARFRAATQQHGPFSGWDGEPAADPDLTRLHAYGQHLMRTQLRALDERHATLLFDLPLGVHRDGYDAWRHADSFTESASAGAPPDAFFTAGQDWTFAPMHPERIRASGYAYPIACLRHILAHARVLRIDHVMGLHRLWWIPDGSAPSDGAYVSYRPEEWYAIVCLEASRAQAMVVGEDLGTVPTAVRRSMARHGLHRTYVVQEELDERRGLRPIRRDAVAGINTHDMPPFASFWQGLDIDRRLQEGLLDDDGAVGERARRDRIRGALVKDLRARGVLDDADDTDAVREALLRVLGRSDAPVVVVSFDDLLGEIEPTNRPGIAGGTSWRRRMSRPLDAAFASAEGSLKHLDAARKEEAR